jgi:tetratricopeptide (TPR) repeat protein
MATDPRRLRELFEAVVDLPPRARGAALRELDAGPLADEVLALCRAGEAADTRRLQAARDAVAADLLDTSLEVGTRVGVWRVVGEAGRGGMGRVYQVERDDGHYTQRAAMKFVAGCSDAERLTGFHRERQLLAELEHPGVARLLDGGTADDGRPYLVMAWVDGVHIDEWCRTGRLPVRDIARLFVDACDTLAYAHRRLVVHCDIKPGNLMVDRDGRVMLLDFGVARLVRAATQDPAGQGAVAGLGYTPRYASPEQQAGGAITTASDVYSLGVLLGELVAAAPDPVPRALQAVIDKARDPDSGQRYGTADALREELARVLDDRPVLALAGDRVYRARCFLRRHALPVALGAALLLALGGGLVATLGALSEAQGQRQLAERTAAFLGSVLGGVDPDRARDLDRTLMREVLEGAAARAALELADDPVLLAGIERVIGTTYGQLSEFERATGHLQQAVDRLPRRAHRERLELRILIADQLDAGARQQEALSLLEAIRAESLTRFGPRDPVTLRAGFALADQLARMGDWQRALEIGGPLRPLLEQVLGPEDPATLGNLQGQAIALGWAGRAEEAERTHREVIERLARLHGEDHSRTLSAITSLAILLLESRRYGEAEALLRPRHEPVTARFGEHSVQAINLATMIASAIRLGGDAAGSEAWYRLALDRGVARFGEGHPNTLHLEVNMANVEVALGRAEAGLRRLERVGPALLESRGTTSRAARQYWAAQGAALAAAGRREAARQAWAEALAVDRQLHGRDDHPDAIEALRQLAALSADEA